jgi:hypothetical protein
MGNGVISSGVKLEGREANHSPPSSAEVKKSGSVLTVPHMPLYGAQGILLLKELCRQHKIYSKIFDMALFIVTYIRGVVEK